jgi:hypothetical protein
MTKNILEVTLLQNPTYQAHILVTKMQDHLWRPIKLCMYACVLRDAKNNVPAILLQMTNALWDYVALFALNIRTTCYKQKESYKNKVSTI